MLDVQAGRSGVTDPGDRTGPRNPDVPAGPALHRRAAPGRARSGLTLGRLASMTALVLTLPLALGLLALTYRAPDPPPEQTAPVFEALENELDPLTRAQMERSTRASRLIHGLTGPSLISPAQVGMAAPGARPTLTLVPREQPYSLRELRELVPGAFIDLSGPGQAGDALLLTANLQVPTGATLVIDTQTPDLRLLSTAAGFVTIMSRGTLIVAGNAQRPVRIASWDPRRGAADDDLQDGRSFVLQSGGRMDASHGVFEDLGFNLGLSSGVTWNSSGYNLPSPRHVKVQGNVTSTVFRHNYFGAYTREAEGMRWVGNTFADNEAYGFDPHDFSNNFLVEGNVAYGNGKHGFIFSRGCSGNTLRDNFSHDNAGHGFMIDDGRTADAGTERARIDNSDNNRILDNVAHGNGGSGVEIEGGTGNVVAGNRLAGNYLGVRVKDDASVVVRDNVINDNLRYGIDVLHSGSGVTLTGNTISGSWGAVNLAAEDSAVLASNTVSDVSAPLVVDGIAIRQTGWVENVAAFLRWHPMLVLWSLLLGVPMVVLGWRLLHAAARYGGAGIRRRVGPRSVPPRHRAPVA